MNRVFAVTPPNNINREQLGFVARSIRIDNPTPAFYYLPAVYRYIPPFSSGIVIPLSANANEIAEAAYQAPPGVSQPTLTGAIATATFIYDEEDSAPDSGVGLLYAPSPNIIPISVKNGASNQLWTFPFAAYNGFTLYLQPDATTFGVGFFTASIRLIDHVSVVGNPQRVNLLLATFHNFNNANQIPWLKFSRPIAPQWQLLISTSGGLGAPDSIGYIVI